MFLLFSLLVLYFPLYSLMDILLYFLYSLIVLDAYILIGIEAIEVITHNT